jgi:hypothetical protein
VHRASADSNEVGFQLYLLFFYISINDLLESFKNVIPICLIVWNDQLASVLLPSLGPFLMLIEVETLS